MYVQARENDEDCLLVAKIDNVKDINSIIKALNFSQVRSAFYIWIKYIIFELIFTCTSTAIIVWYLMYIWQRHHT